MPRRRPAAVRAACLLLALASVVPPGGVALAAPSRSRAEDDARILHALSRLTFGARPDDLETVRAMGLEAWIDRQLRPESIPDAGLAPRLAHLKTLTLPTSEILAGYDPPKELRREIQRRRAEMGDDASDEEMRKARRELAARYRGQMAGPPRRVVEELQEAKVLRAVYSERQLDEVMVDFWMNHFNVFAAKGQDRYLTTEYERDVVRPHAWGRFEDLLVATAKSPAMLFYLDNWMSTAPVSARRRPGQGGNRRNGLNENYARELMELHTLGVDGGYTQKDVTELARALTGWTIRGLRNGQPRFAFVPFLHDRGDKVVLGRTIRAGGIEEGETILRMLATHPSTARFLSYKLARRFVADEPPASVVERGAAAFRRTDGNIREVVRAIVTSPEFFSAENRRAKVKTPFEFVVSAVRASGAEVRAGSALPQRIAQMGMPLYLQQPPTGYKDTAEAWVSTSGLLARLNFALDLAGGRVRGVSWTGARAAADLVPGGLSESTQRTLAAEGRLDEPRRAGLVLGSPEFQRR